MRKMILVLICFLGGALPLRAQEPVPEGTPRAGALRRLIEERFTARVREELGLTDQQASQMRDVVGGYFVKRRTMEGEERRLRQSLATQLRPGVAANKDSVARFTDQLLDLKIRYTQSYKDEVKDLSAFLDPVQVAQFLLLRERLLDRIQEAQQAQGDQGLTPRRVRPSP